MFTSHYNAIALLYRYRGLHDNSYPYGYSRQYWHILSARLAFVFAFQFLVYTLTSLIGWLVPDKPEELKFKMEREREVVKALLREREYESDIEDEDDDPVEFKDALQYLNPEDRGSCLKSA